MTSPRRVASTDGVTLAVYETGNRGRPTIVAVHGYPDNHGVWDGIVEQLADEFHVVTYDVRGAGASDKPGNRGAYRMPQLIDDLIAVLDAVSPDAPVHLVAHDWGSIQAWPAMTHPQTAGRIATFTSISGPSLDYAGAWLRQIHKHPRASLRQLAHSYYIGLFQLPVLPEAAARHGLLDRTLRMTSRRTRSARALDGDPNRSEADQVNGLWLYRANMLPRLSSPRPAATEVPVQVLVPEADAFVTGELVTEAPKPWVADFTVRRIAGGHWVVSERPDVVARLVREFIGSRSGSEAAPPRAHGEFGGKFVVVTGGARGIGRATALDFARKGADVLIADVNDMAAKETLEELRELGIRAWAAHLDVSDGAAWEDFAASVRAEHGVADILVNNAGIGMGGPFLGTTTQDWERILGVNLWSVIHGCRLFADQMVDRGEGGHVVNIASAAAYSPSMVYPAYATTKAAVLMLSECLRAELDREGIGVTAVCPGFINTDISRTTTHVGVDEATAQQRREHQIASYARRGYSPEKVAKQIVRAVGDNKSLAVITPEARLLRAVSRFTPALGRRIARLDLNKL
jgi:NAD(P)-dependent dehydrogenase (short-subunit alcohol dehydrogenase family)/pimeloyl-ACP methyl ester carboxylesterase